jgi:hypothetical protein
MRDIQHSSRAGQNGTATEGAPVGARLLAIISLLVAIGIVVVIGGGVVQGGASLTAIDVALLGVAPLLVSIGVGLWRAREWARVLAVVFLAGMIGFFFVQGLLQPDVQVGLWFAVVRSLVPVALLMYLLHPSIRPLFRRRGA